MKFRPSGFHAPLFLALIAGLFSSCGQNPGQTGLDYLDQQGIRLSAPLYHLDFEDFPVDSVFATEAPLNHFGESLLVAGRESDYTARARLGFQIRTPAQRDSLVHGLHLRLTAVRLANAFAGRDWLRSSAQGRDSLTLLVESFSWPDSTGSFEDSLGAFHRRILFTPVPFSTLDPQFKRLDTIRVSPSGAYPDTGVAQDSSQAGSLPHLWERLRTGFGSDSTRHWAVFLEISPLTPADTGMFRFDLRAIGESEPLRRRYLSGLWLGRYNGDSLATVGLPLAPYRIGTFGVPAANYEVRHTGPSTRSLLHGVARGVHLRINRDTLLNRIRLKLNAHTPGDATLGDRLLGDSVAGAFDRRFYVPYAEIRLPVDTALTRVNGPFALDMGITSDVDSLDRDTAFGEVPVGLNDSIRLTVRGGGAYGGVPVDTLVVSYRPHPIDTALRQVLLRWTRDAAVADTFTVDPDGRRRELAMRRHGGWPRATTLGVVPGPAQLRVEVFFSAASVAEPAQLLDSAGKNITSPARLARRFWRPGADSLNVRATRGLRGLLNRVHVPGVGIAPDMFLRSVGRAAFDTATISGASYQRVGYPVLGEIDFRRDGDGTLRIRLGIYLYPLPAEGGQ